LQLKSGGLQNRMPAQSHEATKKARKREIYFMDLSNFSFFCRSWRTWRLGGEQTFVTGLIFPGFTPGGEVSLPGPKGHY
ncbi:MAG TPA: hypothetical protein VFR02_06175, partial [bacterium]|nr:hypothetical protein [bacterium]